MGYVDSNGYFPSYQIIILKSEAGKIFASWPGPCIKMISDWEHFLFQMQDSFLPEIKPLNIHVNIGNPTNQDIFMAFSRNGDSDDVRLFSVQKMYDYLRELISSGSLEGREYEIISSLLENFWK